MQIFLNTLLREFTCLEIQYRTKKELFGLPTGLSLNSVLQLHPLWGGRISQTTFHASLFNFSTCGEI